MIKRLYSDEINRLMKQFPAVAILGPRQCGKTTSAKLFKKENKKNTLYFDLESPADYRKFYDPQLFLSQMENDCVIIDEVQRMPELFGLLRHLIDEKKRPCRFLLLGSATPEMIEGVSETLAGRIAYIDAHPFNFIELPDKLSVMYKHWFRGGFPDSYLAKSEQKQQDWMDNFVRTFIERDLNKLFGVEFSSDLMLRIWRMLAHYHGGILNAQNFAKGLDVSSHTVSRYIDYLCGAFMARKLPSFNYNTKKKLVKAPKVYIRDSGVVNYLQNIYKQTNLKYHPNIGNLWEGYVIEQILNLLPRHVQAYYYRTHDGSEMDLVLVKGILPMACIEIKNTSAPNLTRGMTVSINDLKTKKNFVIVPFEPISYPLGKTLKVFGLNEFLKMELPKMTKK
jgi:uncharacterized protein